MNVTIKDVAILANVSPSSVSRYTSDPSSINAKNAFRIKKAIDELQYVPNPFARSLKSGRSNLIGVIIPSINSYFSQLCRAINDFFYQHGYLVFFCESGENGEKENYYLHEMQRLRFEGIFMATISTSVEEINKVAKGTNIILVDRAIDAEVDTVIADNEYLGEQLTEHVLSLGHQNIVALFGSKKSLHAVRRLDGAKKAMEKYPEAKLSTYMDCYDSTVTYNAIESAVTGSNPPSAIITYGLSVTEEAMSALNSLNIRIIDDIFFACWALADFRKKYRYDVPFISENPYEMGITSCDILLKKLKNPDKNAKPKTHIFPVDFIV